MTANERPPEDKESVLAPAADGDASSDDVTLPVVDEVVEPSSDSPVHGTSGRNDQCPCGSKLKYKSCCLRRAAGRHDDSTEAQSAPIVPADTGSPALPGIDTAVAAERGYFRVVMKKRLDELGFGWCPVPGTIIPVHGADGQTTVNLYRPDDPKPDANGKVRKYIVAKGARMVIDVHPRLRADIGDPTRPLYFTEGVKKADAAITRGLCCVALLGVDCWKGKNARGGTTTLADLTFLHLKGRPVVLVFDSDAWTNPHVARALVNFKAVLEFKGAEVRVLRIPPGPDAEKVGLDDYLADGGDLDDLEVLDDAAIARFATERAIELARDAHLTDAGNAKRLVARHGDDLRYCSKWSCWLIWDGCRWRRDDRGEVVERAKETARAIYDEAGACNDAERRTKVAGWGVQSENVARIQAMVQLARSEPGIPVTPDELDADAMVLNLRNGAVDLRTGELWPHDRDDLITKLIDIDYDPHAEPPRWAQYLEQVTASSAGLQLFLQRAVGYSLTGDTGERVLFVLWGKGQNGKSVFVDTIRALLGDYGMRTPTATLMAKRGNAIPNDVAALKGARFVSATEAEEGHRLATALVKEMTGGTDTMAARFMRAEWFEFRPEFKLFLATNHKPRVSADDQAIWDRLRLVPFTVRIDPVDKQLPQKLRTELAGILAWAVQGCLDWQEHGLGVPDEVRDATAAYRAEMDLLGDFLRDCCRLDPDTNIAVKDLYDSYGDWARETGVRNAWTKQELSKKLQDHGFDPPKRGAKGAWVWRGIGLVHRDAGDVGDAGDAGFALPRLELSQESHVKTTSPTSPTSPDEPGDWEEL